MSAEPDEPEEERAVPMGVAQERAQQLADLVIGLDYLARRLHECSVPKEGREAEHRQVLTQHLVVLTEVKKLARATEVWLAAHEAADE